MENAEIKVTLAEAAVAEERGHHHVGVEDDPHGLTGCLCVRAARPARL